MPTAEVKSVWWACITWPHKSAKLSLSSLLLGANAIKSNNSWSIWTVYALSLSLSACFLRTRFMMSFAKDKGLSLNAAALKPMSKMTPTANFWAQIIFDPYRPPLTLTFLHVSKRGLFQDTMFDRLHNSTLSEDASEVLVQPLPCSTEKATSVGRVVAKPTPRLCSRCASNT